MTPAEPIVTGQSYSLTSGNQFIVTLDNAGQPFSIGGIATRTDTSIGTTEFDVTPAIDFMEDVVTGATGSPSVIGYVSDQVRASHNRLESFTLSVNQSTSVVFTTISGCTITWKQ